VPDVGEHRDAVAAELVDERSSLPPALWNMPMPKRTPLRGSVTFEIVSIDCWPTGWSTKLMRSIIFERSKARYSALQLGSVIVLLVL
jgi:hypothetical protein